MDNVHRQFSNAWSSFATYTKQKRPTFDFLTLHYLYIIGMTFLGSLLIFAGGGIRYIDALFMSSASCTQAGLAVLNINDLVTWQQICLFLLAFVTNPIVIHSATTFIRLYWFQKRFAHIVKETNLRLNIRRTKSRAQSMELEERGVNGREIRVLFDSGRNHQIRPQEDRRESVQTIDEPVMRRKSSVNTIGDRKSFSSMLRRKDSRGNLDSTEDLINAEKKEQALPTEAVSEGSPSASSSERHATSLVEGRDGITFDRTSSNVSQAVLEDEDEKDPVQDHKQPDPIRSTADIRFADLPVPRKDHAEQSGHQRSGSIVFARGSTPAETNLHRSRTAEPPSRSIGAALLEFGQRTMTLDGPSRNQRVHRRRASSVSRPVGYSTTIERAVSTTFRRRRDSSPGSRSTAVKEMTLPYISFQPTIGRNSAFVSLTREQRAELGGIEYRATRTLCWVLVIYYFGFHVVGLVCFITFIYTAQQYSPIVTGDGVTLGWWSFFTSASAFNDLGLTLTPDSFNSFQNATFLLLAASFLIVIGNTGFPCMLRFVIWLAYKTWPKNSPGREEFAFLLDHPRRCFTLLFPSTATWWLFAILIALNGLDLLLFIVLDLGNSEIVDIPVGYRIVVGLFQAFCTRTAGFSAVNLGGLHSAILVSYMIMMYALLPLFAVMLIISRYISVFPVAISIRRTNVYEERSLGIYSAEEEEGLPHQSFVGTHIRRQLGFDLWYIFLALFIIWYSLLKTAYGRLIIRALSKIQKSRMQIYNLSTSSTFFSKSFQRMARVRHVKLSQFILILVVGLSIGYPGVDYSFCGEFHTLSKLVVIALQIRGRHRGLPLKLDRAVLLPSEKLVEREEEDAELRLGRAPSRSINTGTRERQD